MSSDSDSSNTEEEQSVSKWQLDEYKKGELMCAKGLGSSSSSDVAIREDLSYDYESSGNLNTLVLSLPFLDKLEIPYFLLYPFVPDNTEHTIFAWPVACLSAFSSA